MFQGVGHRAGGSAAPFLGSSVAACLAIAATGAAFVLSGPSAGIAVVASIAGLVVVSLVPVRLMIYGLVLYLPLEGLALSHVPGGATTALRYAPEALCWAIFAIRVIPVFGEAVRRMKTLIVAVGLVGVVDVCSTVASGTSSASMVIGIRAELRYVVLSVIVAACLKLNDVKPLARIAVFVATAEALIAGVEYVGGQHVRSLFFSTYNISLGGTILSTSAPVRLSTINGTFSNYNELATVLVAGWVILIAYRRLAGLSSPLYWFLVGLLPCAVVVSGSREGLIALAVCGMWLVRGRVNRALIVIGLVGAVAVSGVALGDATPTGTPQQTKSHSISSLGSRWSELLSANVWSTNSPTTNFRLYLLASEVKYVWGHGALLGSGAGTVVDPRAEAAGTNPLLAFSAGQEALRNQYQYDGNWGVVLLESGVVGVAALALVLVSAGVLAFRGLPDPSATAAVGLLLCAALLTWFEPALQLHWFSAVLWTVVGFAGIAASNNLEAPRRSIAAAA